MTSDSFFQRRDTVDTSRAREERLVMITFMNFKWISKHIRCWCTVLLNKKLTSLFRRILSIFSQERRYFSLTIRGMSPWNKQPPTTTDGLVFRFPTSAFTE